MFTMLRLLRPSRSLQFRFFSRWASSITTHLHGTELSCMLSALQTKKVNKNRFIDLDCAPKKGYHLASYKKWRDFHHKAKHYDCYTHFHTYNYFIGCNHCFKLVQSIKWLALGQKKRNAMTSVMWDDKRGRKAGNWGYDEEMNRPLEG